MTIEEFRTLRPGDIIEGTSCGQFEVMYRMPDSGLRYSIKNVKDGYIGSAYLYNNWTLVRRSNTKIIRLGVQHEDK